MMRLLFIGLIFVIACSCCQSKKEQSNYSGPGEVDYILQDSLTVRMSDMIDSVRYIKLETNEQGLLGRIRNVKLYDGKLFIQDGGGNLCVFADDGHFLNRIGTKGRGPEEYLAMVNFCLDTTNKWVGIITYRIPKIVWYDFTGKFVKKQPVPRNIGSSSGDGTIYNGSLFVYNNIYYQLCSVRIYDVETMDSKIALHPYPIKGLSNSLGEAKLFSETADGITFVKPYSDTLFHFDGTTVKPCYILEHKKPLATQRVFDACYNLYNKRGEINSINIMEYLSKHNYFMGVQKILETSDYLYIDYWKEEGELVYIMWNKNLKKGNMGDGFYIFGEDVWRRSGMGIRGSTDECFILTYDTSDMYNFKRCAKDGDRLDPEMQKIVTEWNEGDNPVVALFYMKKEI